VFPVNAAPDPRIRADADETLPTAATAAQMETPMTPRKKTGPMTGILALLLTVLLCVPGAVAQSDDASTEESAEATTETGETDETAEAAAAPAPTLDTVIATVDGKPLTLGELIAVRRALPAQYQELPGEVLIEGLTLQLVNQLVLAEKAREAGLDETDAIRIHMINVENSTLADAYLRAELEERVTVEAVEAAYSEIEPETEIKASHILVDTEESAAAIRAEIDGGADFAELAKQHGTDGTAPNGGDLGWFVRTDMVPEFADAAFAIEEDGAVAGPIESPFGWHLIQLTGKRERAVPPLEQMREQILAELTEEAQTAILEEARADAEISQAEEGLDPQAIFADELLTPEN